MSGALQMVMNFSFCVNDLFVPDASHQKIDTICHAKTPRVGCTNEFFLYLNLCSKEFCYLHGFAL